MNKFLTSLVLKITKSATNHTINYRTIDSQILYKNHLKYNLENKANKTILFANIIARPYLNIRFYYKYRP